MSLYLIPVPLDEHGWAALPAEVVSVTMGMRLFCVEELRSARRFISAVYRTNEQTIPWDTLQLIEIGKHAEWLPVEAMLNAAQRADQDVGLLSEAGMPAVADPGAQVVAYAHRIGMLVKPLTGPSSMVLALAASGLNGQQFSFVGYLPVEATARKAAIRKLEAEALRSQATQLCIETPYRNQILLEALLKELQPTTRLCIASGLTGPNEYIRTKTIAEWRQQPTPDLQKRPTVFLWGV
jgi:16S rRNA (cytidine1402-2'-O)-methyltransferase